MLRRTRNHGYLILVFVYVIFKTGQTVSVPNGGSPLRSGLGKDILT